MDEAREQLAEAQAQAADTKEQILARLEELQRRFDEQAEAAGRIRRSLLRGNPSSRSARYDDVLQRLKKRTSQRRKR